MKQPPRPHMKTHLRQEPDPQGQDSNSNYDMGQPAAKRRRGDGPASPPKTKRLVRLRSKDAASKLRLAEELWSEGSRQDALAHLKTILDPSTWRTLAPPEQCRGAALTLALGGVESALNLYGAIIRDHGYYFEALLGIARCHLHLKQHKAALEVLQRCHEADTTRSASWHFLTGTAQLMLKNWPAAESHLKKCLELDPQHSLALNNLGLVYKNSNADRSLAREHFTQSLKADPNCVDAAINMASLLMDGEPHELDEAHDLLIRFEQQQNDNPLLHHALGQVLQRQKQWDDALKHYLQAYRLTPRDPDLLTNIGIWHFDTKNYDEAIRWFTKALEIDPDHPDANHFLGTTYGNLGRLDLQLPFLEKSIQSNPDDPVTRFQFAWHLLGAGDWSLGFREYQYRPSRHRATVAANGTPLAHRLPDDMTGDRILVVQDQGIGDEWFFLRFLPELQRRGAELHYWTNSKLAPLLERAGWFSRVWREPPPAGDFAAAVLVGDLPFLLDFRTGSPPPAPLSIQVLPGARANAELVLRATGPGPYVGVTWRAGTDFLRDRHSRKRLLDKSIPIDVIAAWLPAEATIVSLQRHPAEGEISALAKAVGRPVLDAAVFNEDLEQMLGLLACLDHYYAVSNTNVHLAASLRLPCTVFVPMPPEWRWMSAGEVSPWFPDCRVVRQQADGTWPSPGASTGLK